MTQGLTFILPWLFNIAKKVRVEMYRSGAMMAFAVYNATGSDKMSWMEANRLRYSSWADANEDSLLFTSRFGVEGLAVNRLVTHLLKVCHAHIYHNIKNHFPIMQTYIMINNWSPYVLSGIEFHIAARDTTDLSWTQTQNAMMGLNSAMAAAGCTSWTSTKLVMRTAMVRSQELEVHC